MSIRKRPQNQPHFRKPRGRATGRRQSQQPRVAGVRIVGGRLKGRQVAYAGDTLVRPMKDRLREALFNRLGQQVKEKLVIDLFAGTGAVAFEALSRGAARAILVEKHYPTFQWLGRSVAALELEKQCELVFGDAFLWTQRVNLPGNRPWLVFFCPPYEYYTTRREQMLELIAHFVDVAPEDSVLVAEADMHFSFTLLPQDDRWIVHAYRPAQVGIYVKEPAT